MLRLCHRSFAALAAGVLLLGALAGSASAREEVSGPPLSLEEAIAQTLRQSYEIQRARAEVEGRRGAWMAQDGRFDTSVYSQLDYQFEQLPMIRNEITNEIRRRVPLEFLSMGTPDTPGVGVLDVAAQALLDRDPLTGSLFVDSCEDIYSPTIVDVNFTGTDIEGTTLALCLDTDFTLEGIDLDSLAIGSADLENLVRALDLLETLNDLSITFPDVDRDDLEAFIRQISTNLSDLSAVLREQRRRLGGLPSEVEKLDLTWESGVRWQLRNGLQLSAILALRGNDEEFDDKPYAAEFGGSPVAAFYSTTAGLRLIVPLGLGRGKVANRNPVLAAEANFEAQRGIYLHTAAQETLGVIRAYWTAAAARERLELRRESLTLQEEILDVSRALVDANELPGAEMARAEARAADVRRQVAEARRSLVEARVDLVRSMGSAVLDLGATPRTTTALPAESVLEVQPEQWVDTARSRRYDLAAARDTTRSAELTAKKAKADLRRQVDLTLSLSYNGILERGPTNVEGATPEETRAFVNRRYEDRIWDLGRYWDAARGHIAGPSFTVGLRWRLPFQNSTARGRLLQAQSARVDSEIREADLTRRVEIRLFELAGILERRRESLAELETALENLETSLTASEELFRIGDIPLIDLLTTEQQLVDTKVAIVDLRAEIASLEADVRFESGTLLEEPPGREIELAPDLVRTATFVGPPLRVREPVAPSAVTASQETPPRALASSPRGDGSRAAAGRR